MTMLNIIRNQVKSCWREGQYRLSRTHMAWATMHRKDKSKRTPVLVQIQTINTCNGACVMCPLGNSSGTPEVSRMTRNLFDSIIKEIATWQTTGVLVLTLQNEPLMDTRLEDLIRHAKSVLPPSWCIELTTNASLLTEKRALTILDASPDVINISMNATTPETYAEIMPGLSWKELLINVKNVLHMKRSIFLYNIFSAE